MNDYLVESKTRELAQPQSTKPVTESICAQHPNTRGGNIPAFRYPFDDRLALLDRVTPLYPVEKARTYSRAELDAVEKSRTFVRGYLDAVKKARTYLRAQLDIMRKMSPRLTIKNRFLPVYYFPGEKSAALCSGFFRWKEGVLDVLFPPAAEARLEAAIARLQRYQSRKLTHLQNYQPSMECRVNVLATDYVTPETKAHFAQKPCESGDCSTAEAVESETRELAQPQSTKPETESICAQEKFHRAVYDEFVDSYEFRKINPMFCTFTQWSSADVGTIAVKRRIPSGSPRKGGVVVCANSLGSLDECDWVFAGIVYDVPEEQIVTLNIHGPMTIVNSSQEIIFCGDPVAWTFDNVDNGTPRRIGVRLASFDDQNMFGVALKWAKPGKPLEVMVHCDYIANSVRIPPCRSAFRRWKRDVGEMRAAKSVRIPPCRSAFRRWKHAMGTMRAAKSARELLRGEAEDANKRAKSRNKKNKKKQTKMGRVDDDDPLPLPSMCEDTVACDLAELNSGDLQRMRALDGDGEQSSVRPPVASSSVASALACVVCFHRASEYALIPCGHRCLCCECYGSFEREDATCPMCRKPAVMVVKIFG
jgi:hypothetical protein